MPSPPGNNARAVKIDAGLAGIEKSLPLEGGAPRSESKIYMTAGGSHTSTTLAQRQLRLMRSKLKIITMGWYKIATFDLIRSGLSRTTFPSRGRLFSPRRVLRMKFVWAGHAAAPTLKNGSAYRPSSDCPCGQPPSPRGRLPSEVRDRLLRVKPSPAYRGWHGASRDGCGGDPVRFIGPLGKLMDPTSVTP